jgi:hypothetical protein
MESTGVEGLGGSYMELNPEKFAKLVVQECIYVCHSETDRRMIERIFGVEE